MPVVINEFEAVTSPAPEPPRGEAAAPAPAPPNRREIEELLRAAAERELRIAAD